MWQFNVFVSKTVMILLYIFLKFKGMLAYQLVYKLNEDGLYKVPLIKLSEFYKEWDSSRQHEI